MTAMKTAEEFVTFGQGNVEALVKSSQIVATGMQDLTKQIAATMQASMDETMSTFRAMAGVRSIKEAFDLQATLARSTVEKTLAQTGHVADASFKLAEQAIAPLAGRMSVAVERLGKSA
jgi:phasin family protein